MALVNKPDESIFASSAKQGEVDNFPDLLRGWGISFEQTGGIPPMEWFNFLFKRLDEKHTYLMQRGLPEWSATQDYPAGAFVQYQGLSYKALRTNKNSPPSASNSADWQRWGFTLTEIAKASLTQQGIVQLNSATNSDNETMAATPKAVKTAYDLANGKQSPATTLAGYGIGNFKVEPFVGNLNTLKTDGVYAITQASRSQNLPVSTSCHIKVIAGGDGAWCRQLAYVAYSTDVYERHQTSYQTDSWSPWVKIDSLDKIPNSKKSSAVDSNSADTVATSAAVKTAYDKGVEAKNAADGAQRTANDGVSKATTAQNTANSAVTKADGAQRTADDGVSKATTAQNTANSAVTKADNAQRAADNANNNANNRVSKSGDTMTGNLVIKNGSPWSSVVLDNNQGQGIKLESRPNDDVFMGEISYLDIHNGYRNINTLLLPKKSGALALEADVNGKAPLSDFETVKNNYYNKFGFAERAYPSHYNGAHVWTMRFNQFGGLRIIQLRAEIKNSSGTVPIYLPEEMTTQSLSIATDDGYIRYSYGSKVTSNNIVTVYTPQNKTVGINLFVIGWVNF